MAAQDHLPFLKEPHDTLREGLPRLGADSKPAHPLEAALAQVRTEGGGSFGVGCLQ